MKLPMFAALCILGFVVGAGSARAEICALDPVPAATLLLPYFEVDLENPNGRTTLFSVNNAAAEPALVKAVLWTDIAVPTLDFDIYLTGYDVVTVNLRDVFTTGTLPTTGSGVSPTGGFSLPNQGFSGCSGLLANDLPAHLVDHLRASHRGEASAIFGGDCAGVDWEDGRARGFITFDVVRRCEPLYPSQAGYFGENGVAGTRNVLWGDFFYADPAEDFAQGETLVSLEADPEVFGPGDFTFYNRYVDRDGSDAREPLPPVWAVRYLLGGAFSGGTDLVVWRETREPMAPFECGSLPLAELFSEEEWVAFDEDENPEVPSVCPFTCIPPGDEYFLFASERMSVGGPRFPLSFDFGWVHLDFSRIEDGALQTQSQAWTGVLHQASGRFSVGTSGTVLAGACGAPGCGIGEQAQAGRLCVRGEMAGDHEVLSATSVRFGVFPEGCFSSCTFVHEANCAVLPASGFELEIVERFCFGMLNLGSPCTPDCSGGGLADCMSPGPLAAGTYTARSGSLSVEFTVPSTVPLGGLCAGDPLGSQPRIHSDPGRTR